jgi:hypothetical protein
MNMANGVVLNNIEHKNLRVATGHGAALGDAVMFALTFPDEFRSLQAHYPIVFYKNADGVGFQPIALFGFKERQNLFLDGERWDAGYIPLTIERQPFLIGTGDGELSIHVDLDSPRLHGEDGERLFLEHGGTSEYLERINTVLSSIHDGLQRTPAFVAALLELQLLESFVLDVAEPDGSQCRLAGFYTINEERLQALDGPALERLQRAGYLQPIYMAVASLSNFRNLVERQRRAGVDGG